MVNFYKNKNDYTHLEMKEFVEENQDQLKREYIDFRYIVLNPKNLIGLEEFNQEFFDKIDIIENKISQGDTFQSITEGLKLDITEVDKYAPSSTKNNNEDVIYSKRSSSIDLVENGDNFLLFSITNKYYQGPDLNDKTTKDEINELVYQKNNFDLHRKILEDIQNKKFDNIKFIDMAGNNIKNMSLKSINDIEKFETNSVTMLYSLPNNSFTLVSDKENNIYLVMVWYLAEIPLAPLKPLLHWEKAIPIAKQ